ncbi:AlbA family DNA-binding domain-containing protein [Azospirillum argentinense]|uniref:AlbA family DNA-binding domain-containing protein n=1 Tax=Azospirillum argentinense TaxID=2970906 RepID=UPI00190EB414|nr:ATP-binding protein [Azospirillum argentinense]
MPLFRKPLSEITEADLQALIANQVPEGRTLDYKRDTVGRSDSNKKEFLADVSSFANAAGGHLVFGMDEAGGLPTALPGLAGLDADAEIRRLDELIRDGLDPTLLGIELRAVPLADGAAALVIRIPKSWNPPHQVTYQKTFRFYGRGAAGKHPLDVTTVRDLVLLSADVAERVRRFRIERVAQIVADETPVPLKNGARLIVHLVPLSAFGAGNRADLSSDHDLPLIPMIGIAGRIRYNVDGLLGYRMLDERTSDAYVQLFHNGALEVVHHIQESSPYGRPILPMLSFMQELTHAVTHGKTTLRRVGLSTPVVMALTLTGMQNWILGTSHSGRLSEVRAFDRNPLFVPDALLTGFDGTAEADLHDLVDSVWQAAGWPRCPDYDADGQWIGQWR